MITSVTVHWAMLVVQYFVIFVYGYGPLVSWWVFVAMSGPVFGGGLVWESMRLR